MFKRFLTTLRFLVIPASGKAWRRESGLVLVVSLVAVLAGSLVLLFAPHSKVETLIAKTPYLTDWTVRDNTLYALSITESEIVVRYSPLTERKLHVLYRATNPGQTVTDVCFTDSEVLYISRPLQITRDSRPTFLRAVSPPGVGQLRPAFLKDEYLERPVLPREHSKSPDLTDGDRWRFIRIPEPTYLHRIPLNGTPPTQQKLNLMGYMVDSLPRRLTPEGLYFVVPQVPRLSVIFEKAGTVTEIHKERPATDTVYLLPFDSSVPRPLHREGLFSILLYCDKALYARMPTCFPNSRQDLVRLIGEGGKMHLADYASREAPVRLGNQLYWLEEKSIIGDGGDKTEVQRLQTCHWDGSGQRIVWQAKSQGGSDPQLSHLFVYQEKLYGFDMQYQLHRLRPDSPQLFGNKISPPDGVGALRPVVSDGFYYFSRLQSRRGLLDPFSERVLTQTTLSFCRMRLPE
jgi:hypothetical protein